LRATTDVTIKFTSSAETTLAGNTHVQVQLPFQWGAVISAESYSGITLKKIPAPSDTTSSEVEMSDTSAPNGGSAILITLKTDTPTVVS